MLTLGAIQALKRHKRSKPRCRLIGIGEDLAILPLPHHRAYGAVHGGSMNKFRHPARDGSPKLLKTLAGRASDSAGVFDRRHGPCALLLVFHASRTDTPRLRSSR